MAGSKSMRDEVSEARGKLRDLNFKIKGGFVEVSPHVAIAAIVAVLLVVLNYIMWSSDGIKDEE